MYHNIQALNKADLKQMLFLALSISMVALFTNFYIDMELITGIRIDSLELVFICVIGIGICN